MTTQRYPELQAHVDSIVRAACVAINQASATTKSDMPYKAQFILEHVIAELQAKV